MVSYYNSLPYSQKHNATNLPYPAGQPWTWQANYLPPPNPQFLGDVDAPRPVPNHTMQYYNHMLGNHPPADWHSTENFQNATQSHLMQQQHHHQQHHQQQHHPQQQQQQHQHQAGTSHPSTSSAVVAQNVDRLTSPAITVSRGSAVSSPKTPASSSTAHQNLSTSSNSGTANNNNSSNNTTMNHSTNFSSAIKSYDWMKKQTYSAQPTPGKTRTKDKYRVVYSDHQRLELEKEYCTSRYITIRRKTELAQALQLSERQIKIWFQNRRAKERKQNKKRDETMSAVTHCDLSSYMDNKPKIEPSLHHLQHPLHHPMSSMAMNMPMSLHHHHPVLHHGHHLPPPQHLQSQMSAAAAASLQM